MAKATQKEVREAAATVRQNLREAVEWYKTGNYLNAYAAAERAQFAAFDFKDLMTTLPDAKFHRQVDELTGPNAEALRKLAEDDG
jgi:hypothetical protein